MQATPSITEVLIVAMPRPISRSGMMPRPCVITMVLEALKKPMPTMAPMAARPAGGGARERQGGEEGNDHQAAADGDPFARVQQAVQRAEGEHANLVGDDGDEQDVAGLDRREAMPFAQE